MNKPIFTLLTCAVLTSACSHDTKTATTTVTNKSLQGTWTIEYIEDRPVIDLSPATLIFNNNGKLSGNSSCNRLMSSYTFIQASTEQKYNSLSFGQTAGTMMMCSETLMNQEQQFLAALAKVTQVNIINGLLILNDKDNKLIFKASKQQPKSQLK